MKCPFKVLLSTLLVSAITIFGCASTCLANPALQKTKPKPAVQEEEPDSPPGYEEEYKCWSDADQEKDFLKRGPMLIECIKKYPKSTLMPTFEGSYKNMLFESSNNKKYQELETLAEDWLKLHANDYDTIARIAEAADKLGHDEKCVQSLVELYKMKPTSSLPVEIAKIYLKLKNKAKYIEWVEIALKLPENETNFLLRINLVQEYMESKDRAKAMEWARAAIKSAALVKDPSAETRTQLAAVLHTCYDIIAKISYEQDKYPEAIKAFKQALKIKEYAEGYYFIALCIHAEKKAEDAMLWYAKTEIWCEKKTNECGEFATKAKDNLEKIYKSIHDGSLVGIEKKNKLAREKAESFWTSDES
jgi:tetratricopeptide (TPR) repeat protein